MGGKTWVTADHHFGHKNILKFEDSNGDLIREGFSDIQEMNEYMVEKWNEVVSPGERVYHLGDFTFHGPTFDRIAPRLNGRIVLVKGNHDPLRISRYMKYFDDIRSVVPFHKIGIMLSHYPIHQASLYKFSLNVHGHLHQKSIMLNDDTKDTQYLCISVEQTDYTPVDMEYIKKIANNERSYYDDTIV